jgi:hypothetical protein
LRRSSIIAGEIDRNLTVLERGGWSDFFQRSISSHDHRLLKPNAALPIL